MTVAVPRDDPDDRPRPGAAGPPGHRDKRQHGRPSRTLYSSLMGGRWQLLGRPTEKARFPLKNEEVWSWRHQADGQTSAFFNVHLDPEGRVTGTSRSPDTPMGG